MTLSDRPKDVITWEPQLAPKWREAIGKISIFAAVIEQTLHRVYWYYADLPLSRGVIVTTDMNPKRLSEDVLKFAAISPKNKRRLDDLKVLMKEYTVLGGKRNQVMHRIWEQQVADIAEAKPPAYKPKEIAIPFTLKELDTLADDLAWLDIRLRAHYHTNATIRAEIARLNGQFPPYVPAPWLDKPPQPKRGQGKSPASRKGRPRRPRSSPR